MDSEDCVSEDAVRFGVDHALAYWARSNAYAEPGASEAELAAFEAANSVRLPPAFAELYRAANGNHGDANLTRFWPLAEVKRLTNDPKGSWEAMLPGARDYFVFADYLISSHLYAVRLARVRGTSGTDDGDRVLWVIPALHGIGAAYAEVAGSFAEFLHDYVRDPDALNFHPHRR